MLTVCYDVLLPQQYSRVFSLWQLSRGELSRGEYKEMKTLHALDATEAQAHILRLARPRKMHLPARAAQAEGA